MTDPASPEERLGRVYARAFTPQVRVSRNHTVERNPLFIAPTSSAFPHVAGG